MQKLSLTNSQPKQVIKGEQLARVHQLIENQKEIIYYILFCPSYPNNGSQFTYQAGEISTDLPYNYHSFEKKIDQHLYHLVAISKQLSHPISDGQIIIKPLVCEIEKDLSHVVDKFSHGSPDIFEQKVADIAGLIGDNMKARYQGYGIDIQPALFSSINNLASHQKYIEDKIASHSIPESFTERSEIIAKERSYMFENLYGAYSDTEKLTLAVRQMKNYLAVTLGISLQNPGSFIINAKTPNRYYVEHPETHKILDISRDKIALYTFLH